MSAAPWVRRARAADVAAILALEEQFPTDRMSRATVRRFLSVPSAAVWVALLAGRVAGALVLLTRRGSRTARIYSVVVDPAARGRGLAQALVAAAERAARRRGGDAMALEVRADNAAARGLYAKLGYAETAELPGYYQDGGDGVRMRKAL